MLTDNHEKNRAWKRIWFLSQTDETGNFIYYPGLTKLERLEFWEDYFDFLDYEPGKDSSETNPDPQADVDRFEGEPRGLYHPVTIFIQRKARLDTLGRKCTKRTQAR